MVKKYSRKRTRSSDKSVWGLRRKLRRDALTKIAPGVGKYIADAADWTDRANWNVGKYFYNKVRSGFSPTRKARATSSSSRPSRSSGRRYVTAGKIDPKFKRPTMKKINNFLRDGVVHKVEARTVVDDSNSVYVGHWCLPQDPLLKTVMRSFARTLLRRLGHYMSDPQELSTISEINMTMHYRTTFEGVILSSNAAVGTPSVNSLGDTISSCILTPVTNTTRYFEIVDFIFGRKAGTDTDIVYRCTGNNIVFDIVGKSVAAIQNRTLSGTIASPDGDAHDVTNNPLRGKHYRGWGNIHTYRYNNDAAVLCPTFRHGAQDGILVMKAAAGDLTAEMQTVLKKPPPRLCFGQIKSCGYVKLDPGKIKHSTLKHQMTLNVNQLLKKYLENYAGQSTFTTVEAALCNSGSSEFFGFEKVLETDSTVNSKISVGMEVNVTISSLCKIHQNRYMNPIVDVRGTALPPSETATPP